MFNSLQITDTHLPSLAVEDLDVVLAKCKGRTAGQFSARADYFRAISERSRWQQRCVKKKSSHPPVSGGACCRPARSGGAAIGPQGQVTLGSDLRSDLLTVPPPLLRSCLSL